MTTDLQRFFGKADGQIKKKWEMIKINIKSATIQQGLPPYVTIKEVHYKFDPKRPTWPANVEGAAKSSQIQPGTWKLEE